MKVEKPKGGFRVLMADPPWSFNDSLAMDDRVKRGAVSNYDTMSPTKIGKLPVPDVMADDSICVLWIPGALIEDGLYVLDSWGYTVKQIWTWVKTGKSETWDDDADIPENLKLEFGMGRLTRNCCEYALVGTKGKMMPFLKDKAQRNVILAPNLKHSAKPEKMHVKLEQMFPGEKKLEMFGRRARHGWHVCGNQSPETMGEDISVSLKRLVRDDCKK